MSSLIKLKNQLREFVDNDDYEVECPGGGTHPGEPFYFSVLDVETEFNEMSEQLTKQQEEIAEYRKVIIQALNINNLWMYFGDIPKGQESNAEALGLMNNSFLDVLDKHNKGE